MLDIIRIKTGHLKGENNEKVLEVSIQMNWMDIEGLIASQRNELVVPRQNITVAYTSDLEFLRLYVAFSG